MDDSRIQKAIELFRLTSSSETSLFMAEKVGTGLLDDLIGQARKLRKEAGDGFLILRIRSNDAMWETAAGLEAQIRLAERNGDFSMAMLFSRLARQLETLNPDEKTLIAVTDHKGMRAYLIDNANPAGTLPQLLRLATEDMPADGPPLPPGLRLDSTGQA